MAHLRNHLRQAHKIEDGATRNNAIQSNTNSMSHGDSQSHLETGKIGTVELLPVTETKRPKSKTEPSPALREENEAHDTVAVKVEICPQLPMTELRKDDSNSADEEEEEDSEADFGKNEFVNDQTNETERPALVMTKETSPQSEKAEELNKKTIVDPVPPICDTVSPLTMEEAEKPRNGDIIRSHDCEIFAEAVSDRKSSMTRKDSIKAESPNQETSLKITTNQYDDKHQEESCKSEFEADPSDVAVPNSEEVVNSTKIESSDDNKTKTQNQIKNEYEDLPFRCSTSSDGGQRTVGPTAPAYCRGHLR